MKIFRENMTTFFVLTLFFLFGSSASTSLISDFHALITVKQGFEFPEPGLSTWNSSNPTSVCSWVGVKCFKGRVVSLDLSDMNLYGSVSSVFLSLDKLTELSLAGNNFTGEIKIGNLSSLRSLNISNNQFYGGLDWDYSSLEDLEVFDAYNNNFTTSLPLGISSLKKLRHLDLGGNYFFGEIPGRYGNLIALEYLLLMGNDLEGKIPGELGNLTNLKHMELGYYNVFEGGIPREFGKLVNLVHLDLSKCELDGLIPRELGNLNSLETFYLHTNLLSGSIPKQLGNLTSLVNLDLSNNALTGEVPYELVSLKQLKLLNLFMNRLHGSIPEFVADFPNLETLQLWMNNFTGTIPKNLGQNGNLQDLDLSSNKLTGTIPQNLCASGHLRILILLKNFLFGSIPENLGKCSSLVRVRLGQNYLNGSIPSGFIYLPQLNLVELQDNYLSGTLSENVNSTSKPNKLSELNLSNNLLSGSLPFSLSNFSSLQTLLLGGNQFSGPIPPSIGELHQVLKLDLRGNSLSGEIPPEIGNCFHLTYLDLSKNNLSSSIPPEISNTRILNYLNLSRNHFNETIPKSIGSMKSLTIADFSFNDLSGNLPETGQFAFFNASSFVGNPQLCGSLLNNPCNVTTTTKPTKKASGDFKLIFALGLLICSLVFAAAAIIKAKSFKKSSGSSSSWKMTAFKKVEFMVSEVLECMKDGNVIGRGGAGIVYHGKMSSGTEIAVKKLLGFGTNSHDHGFRAEIRTLGNIRHRNIVRLLAFCSNKETNLLVYEYMRNGSLGEALHGKKGSFLGWHLRYKIALEAARGLCYLHHDCSPLIVHRDVKSNNILLNSSFEAHVADFGLAKFLGDGGASQCMSAVAGSYGYIAPEYAYTLRVDEKSDVYSFGVVLLELITGRRPVGEFGEGVDIVQWTKKVTSCRREEVLRIVDPRVLANVPQDEAMHLFFIAMLCTQENSIERPTMREVVQMLSEFPRHSPENLSSSSAIFYQQPKNFEKEKNCPKLRNDLLV
ncbi:Leucine-rich repeat receptor-like serine/threonine-protein kinase [Actinidia chinensis var. chinensis]|uniref:non-specific serine/threonine protein kinase n=1 Tax=Actinidia chinensis var. chinensis TaxID=1590841 RepID=A0A2R6Q6K9_ACTCC|nr:Leucine-rich repeat receptor-like serine/threonine-protein kinase [Actinidia chinensis var. chinensis]